VGSNQNNGTIDIRGVFTVPDTLQLQRATLVLPNLLTEKSDAGELVRRSDGAQINLPVVLPAMAKSSSRDAVYATLPNTTPRMRVEIIANKSRPDLSKFHITVDQAQISSPTTCSGNPSVTHLHTRMVANDGTHTSAVFDGDLAWRCDRGHKLTTLVPKTKISQSSP
jgi:hypothetical protein